MSTSMNRKPSDIKLTGRWSHNEDFSEVMAQWQVNGGWHSDEYSTLNHKANMVASIGAGFLSRLFSSQTFSILKAILITFD